MKLLITGLGLVVALLLAALWYQHRASTTLNETVTALQRDRDSTRTEVDQLRRQLKEVQARTPAPAAAGDARATAAPAATGSVATAEIIAPSQPAPRPGVTVGAPPGWAKNGAKPDFYAVGVDANETWGGMPSAYVESLTPTVDKGFGGMMQTTAAENYAGKRVRLSGWIKTQDANEGGGRLWLRVDGQERGQMLGFDNMNDRAVKGTSDWQEASIVLDVPDGASALAYGFFVSGGGKMWVNGQNIEVVGSDVPTTNMLKQRRPLPTAPRNLGFKADEPNG